VEDERYYAWTELRRWERLPRQLCEVLGLRDVEQRFQCAAALAQRLGFDATDVAPITLAVFWRIFRGLTDAIGRPQHHHDQLAEHALLGLDIGEICTVACDLGLGAREVPSRTPILELCPAATAVVGSELACRVRHLAGEWERQGVFRRDPPRRRFPR
jgi:hypothetical protein